MSQANSTDHYVVLSGGVGGAKLVLGLSRILPSDQLTIIANTGDDFEHLGLPISPDLDTLMYTLGGVVNEDTGWGCKDETWSFMAGLERLGGQTWFRLGDRDLATHIERARRLATGASLTEVTAALCECLDVEHRILPMSDQPVRTRVHTDSGALDFQHYFVRERAAPSVHEFEYTGADSAPPNAAALAALSDPGLAGIIIAPSNPYLSIDPMLAMPALRTALAAATAPVVAISPIVGGDAIKGPTAKIMRELHQPVSAVGIARHYAGLLDGLIIDTMDRDMVTELERLGVRVAICETIMKSLQDKISLARVTLDCVSSLAPT
jgi:LPPG:FO 2-phospho-L-lactate transferase